MADAEWLSGQRDGDDALRIDNLRVTGGISLRIDNFRWGVPIYYGALALVTARQSVFEDSAGLWVVHLFGASIILLSLVQSGLTQKVLTELRNPRTWPLPAFALYFALMAVLHPTVSGEFIRSLAKDVSVPIALGIITFFPTGKNARLETFGMVTGMAFLVVILFTVLPFIRTDIFLISTPNYYQSFGVQISLLVVSVIAIAADHAGPAAYKGMILWAFGTPVFILTAALTIQAVGSNNAFALIGIFALSFGIWGLWSTRNNVRNMLKIMVGGLVGLVVGIYLVVVLPPMRFMQFQDNPELQTLMHNIDARMEIAQAAGTTQFTYSPTFGDLAVDRIITGGPGQYIHSIVSVQTHLGVVGSLLLLAFLVLSISQVMQNFRAFPILLLSIPPIMILATQSFFTWQPLWFLAGGLFIAQVSCHITTREAK